MGVEILDAKQVLKQEIIPSVTVENPPAILTSGGQTTWSIFLIVCISPISTTR